MRIAILDVDGTLYGGNLGIDLVKSLIKNQLFADDIGIEIFKLYEKYKSGEMEKSTVVDLIYKLFAEGLKDKIANDVNVIAKKTLSEVIENTFSYTNDLINLLKKYNYHIVLLSGSPIEILKHFGKAFQIEEKDIIGGITEIEKGKYTGKLSSYPGSSEQKVRIFEEWVKVNKFEIKWDNVLVLGNNERDFGLLSRSGLPIAVNPDIELERMAKNNKYYLADSDSVLSKVKGLLS